MNYELLQLHARNLQVELMTEELALVLFQFISFSRPLAFNIYMYLYVLYPTNLRVEQAWLCFGVQSNLFKQ